ncbi:MAG TPA: hypothetical protein PK566_10770 [Pseudobacteroides sp.]|nr:hypothetical protein [Pseudobacteroides sp.]
MDTIDLSKIAKTGSYEISVDATNNILFVKFLGLWDKTSQLEYYLEDIVIAINKLTPGFNSIIDLSLYKGSTSEYIQLHIEAQNLSLKGGLNKTTVILRNNPMLKVTTEYILNKSGIKATYFKSISAALRWLYLLNSQQAANSNS